MHDLDDANKISEVLRARLVCTIWSRFSASRGTEKQGIGRRVTKMQASRASIAQWPFHNFQLLVPLRCEMLHGRSSRSSSSLARSWRMPWIVGRRPQAKPTCFFAHLDMSTANTLACSDALALSQISLLRLQQYGLETTMIARVKAISNHPGKQVGKNRLQSA